MCELFLYVHIPAGRSDPSHVKLFSSLRFTMLCLHSVYNVSGCCSCEEILFYSSSKSDCLFSRWSLVFFWLSRTHLETDIFGLLLSEHGCVFVGCAHRCKLWDAHTHTHKLTHTVITGRNCGGGKLETVDVSDKICKTDYEIPLRWNTRRDILGLFPTGQN